MMIRTAKRRVKSTLEGLAAVFKLIFHLVAFVLSMHKNHSTQNKDQISFTITEHRYL